MELLVLLVTAVLCGTTWALIRLCERLRATR